MNWFKKITDLHNEWVRACKTFGAGEYSEDIVQETYIRLLKYTNEEKLIKNNKINKLYIYLSLRNTYIIFLKKHRKNTDFEISSDKLKYLSKKQQQKHITTGLHNIDIIRNLEEIDMMQRKDSVEIILNNIYEEMNNWHWFDKMLYEIYIESGKSIRQLAIETKISKDTIWRTLKSCNDRIRLNVGEDYEDFLNRDYELIKDLQKEKTKKLINENILFLYKR